MASSGLQHIMDGSDISKQQDHCQSVDVSRPKKKSLSRHNGKNFVGLPICLDNLLARLSTDGRNAVSPLLTNAT